MWLSAILYTIVFILLIVWIYNYVTYKPPNFPKGPIRLPIGGSYIESLLRNWNFPQVAIQAWKKRYGGIFGMYVGPFLTVICCDYDSVKAALIKPEFDGKPDLPAARLRALNQKIGIFFTDGPYWHEQRRFSLRHLRDFGFGRRFEKLERLMQDEIQSAVDFLRCPSERATDSDICDKGNILFPDVLYPPMMNSILSIFGKEPELPNSEVYRFYRDLGRNLMCLQRGLHAMSSLSFAPWLRHFVPGIIGYTNIQKSNKGVHPFMKKILDELKEDGLDGDVKNFIDIYMRKMAANRFDEDTTFSDDQLHLLTVDYIFPAVTAVPVKIVFLLQYFLNYPDIQAKIQKEIDEVVGRGRLPTLDDRVNLPYTEATIREMLRKETLVPLGIPHRCLTDTEFKGYTIPKDTLVITYLEGAHMDSQIWGDPHNFRPERFLDESGVLKRKDYSLPFGAGKRLCAGETFARYSMFLLLTGLAQNFTFAVPKGGKAPNISNKIGGLINDAGDLCWVRAIPRE